MNQESGIKKYKNFKQGFSLVEMMVAVALFVAVMLIGVGALFSLIDANKKAQALNSVMNNLNFAVESMSRNLRVGTSYDCGGGGDCASGGTSVSFISSRGESMVYRYNDSDPDWKRIEVSKDGGSSFTAITAQEVVIDDFAFLVEGSSPADNFQPKIIIKIRGTAGIKEKIRTNFDLQTMVSQRVLDE